MFLKNRKGFQGNCQPSFKGCCYKEDAKEKGITSILDDIKQTKGGLNTATVTVASNDYVL